LSFHSKIILCPFCGSEEVSKPQWSAKAFAISVLLIGIPLPFLSKTRHCFNCGKDFKSKGKGKQRGENESS